MHLYVNCSNKTTREKGTQESHIYPIISHHHSPQTSHPPSPETIREPRFTAPSPLSLSNSKKPYYHHNPNPHKTRLQDSYTNNHPPQPELPQRQQPQTFPTNHQPTPPTPQPPTQKWATASPSPPPPHPSKTSTREPFSQSAPHQWGPPRTATETRRRNQTRRRWFTIAVAVAQLSSTVHRSRAQLVARRGIVRGRRGGWGRWGRGR